MYSGSKELPSSYAYCKIFSPFSWSTFHSLGPTWNALFYRWNNTITGSVWQVGWSKVYVNVRLYITWDCIYIYTLADLAYLKNLILCLKKSVFEGFGFITRIMFEVKLTRILFNTPNWGICRHWYIPSIKAFLSAVEPNN